MASTIFKKYRPIFATRHRTAKRNNLYSTINPSGSGDRKNIPLSTILKKALGFTPIKTPIFARTYFTAEGNDLHSQILGFRDPIPVLEQRLQEGKGPKLQHIVQELYDKEQFEKAAQVLEWLSNKGLPVFVVETYVQLDLIYRVQGLEAAESYFNNLNDEDKTIAVYRTLLTCYFLDASYQLLEEGIEEGLLDKCIIHLQKMMELGFLYSDDCYDNLLTLYAYRGQVEKIPVVLSDMREKGVSVDYVYEICMHAYGVTSDISSMELILEEMQNYRTRSDLNWITYLTVANVCVKAGLKEKALIYLKKCAQRKSESLLNIDDDCLQRLDVSLRSHRLIHVDLCGLKADMGFITKMACLVKIGELKEAEKLFQEWRGVFFRDLLQDVFACYEEWEKGEIFKVGLN